ncbi:hypothetical protein ACO2I3_12290 [Leptospira interrogans]
MYRLGKKGTDEYWTLKGFRHQDYYFDAGRFEEYRTKEEALRALPIASAISGVPQSEIELVPKNVRVPKPLPSD